MSTGVLRTCIADVHFIYIYIFMHMDALLVYDVLPFVCTWMCLMICYMCVLHVDASSLGCWHVDAPCVVYVM